MRSSPAPDSVIRVRPHGPGQLLVLFTLAGFSGVLIYMIITIVDDPKPVYGGAIITAGVLALMWCVYLLFALRVFRPTRITQSDLFIPRLFSTLQVPLDEIAGVGLVFQKAFGRGGGFSGWYPYVWRRDGTAVQLSGFMYAPARWIRLGDVDGKRTIWVKKGNVDEMRSTEPSVLAKSAAAQLVVSIYSRVCEIQGRSGLLASYQMQKHRVPPREIEGSFTAFWSPDDREMVRLA